jgi:hypothetical protein
MVGSGGAEQALEEVFQEAQADACGVERDGPTTLLVGAEENAQRVHSAELLDFVAEGGEFGEELFTGGARELGIGNGLLDKGGVVVGGLAATASLLGLVGDGAVLAEQDGEGVAEPGEDR